ncbi:MAG: purine-binding chemotaxis protein CheW [Steroidobacteraceae bacterium]|nr:purine-binding chemotaxis protein CheW [Steroidobacteraceae bacterium]
MNAVTTSETSSGAEQFLTFVLGGEEYGVTILQVQGIQGWDRVTPIPNTPDYILGVINLRGAIVPIVDLRRRFGMPAAEFGPTTVVIVVKVVNERGERTLGLVVDAVSEVCSVSAEARQPAPDFGSGIKTDFVKGLATVDNRMVILLDIDRMVSEGLLGSLSTH